MFRPIPAIIRFSSETVLEFIRFMPLCNDGEISSSVVFIIIIIIIIIIITIVVKVKVKQSRYSSGVAQRVPGS